MRKRRHSFSSTLLNSIQVNRAFTLVFILPIFKITIQPIYPGDPEAQAELIAHLQEEHYAQYMAQLSLRENEDEPVPAPVLPLNEREIKIEAPSMWTRPQIRYRPLRSDKALLDECPLVLRPEALLPSPRYKKGGTPNYFTTKVQKVFLSSLVAK